MIGLPVSGSAVIAAVVGVGVVESEVAVMAITLVVGVGAACVIVGVGELATRARIPEGEAEAEPDACCSEKVGTGHHPPGGTEMSHFPDATQEGIGAQVGDALSVALN